MATKPKKVLVGLPQHAGVMSAQTFQSGLTAQSLQGHDVQFQVLGLSLLARNFNQLFKNAWKHGFDVFVLHHSDILAYPLTEEGAVSSWLDILIERMYHMKAACISVASPIKSEAGHTSFGMQLEKGDNPWSLRRITIKQLNKLPQTISREDCCKLLKLNPNTAGAMLINTGVLVMDLRNFMWNTERWPGFQIKDKLAWNKECTDCEPFTEPEDWRLSRWLHDRDWPYYCVRDIGIDHVGVKIYKNHGYWGFECDDTPIQPSIAEYEQS
jgi:hypothetical protein